MKNWTWALAISSLIALMVPIAIAHPPQEGKAPPPPWAYGFSTPPNPGDTPPQAAGGGTPPDNVTQKHVEGSSLAFTQQQIGNAFGPAVWFPAGHPTMPDIVAHC